MSRTLIISTPGKVILHGEHAVVYGKAALATSVDLRCYLILTPTLEGRVTLHLPEFVPETDLKEEWPVAELESGTVQGVGEGGSCTHEHQLQTLRRLSGVDGDEAPSILSMAKLVFLYLLVNIYKEKIKTLSGLKATVISNLPAGAGLGSSAAYSVCLAAGFLGSCGLISSQPDSAHWTSTGPGPENNTRKQIEVRMKDAGVDVGIGMEKFSWCEQDLEVINKWGCEAEKLIHGTPSGIDNSISTYGSAISFKAGVISHLKKMPKIRILLINTKVPRSTKKMVAGVREKYDKFTSIVSPVLESIDNITQTAQSLLRQLGDLGECPTYDGNFDHEIYSQLKELFGLNQHLLNALGVGHPAIDKVCSLATSLGLSAKLTGGGGGGCVIALLPSEISSAKLLEFKGVFEDAGFDCWETNIGCCGTSLHSVTN